MPKGIKLIAGVNVLLAGIFILNLLFMETTKLNYPFASYINLIGAAALLLVAIIVLFRINKLVGFARLLVYVLALVLGLQALLSIKYLFSLYGALTIVVDVVVIFYAIGLRGYLASERAAAYFVGKSSHSNS